MHDAGTEQHEAHGKYESSDVPDMKISQSLAQRRPVTRTPCLGHRPQGVPYRYIDRGRHHAEQRNDEEHIGADDTARHYHSGHRPVYLGDDQCGGRKRSNGQYHHQDFHDSVQQVITANYQDHGADRQDNDRNCQRAHLQAEGDFRETGRDQRNGRERGEHRTERDNDIDRNRPLALDAVAVQQRIARSIRVLGTESKRRVFRDVREQNQQHQRQAVICAGARRLHQVRRSHCSRGIQNARPQRLQYAALFARHDTPRSAACAEHAR